MLRPRCGKNDALKTNCNFERRPHSDVGCKGTGLEILIGPPPPNRLVPDQIDLFALFRSIRVLRLFLYLPVSRRSVAISIARIISGGRTGLSDCPAARH